MDLSFLLLSVLSRQMRLLNLIAKCSQTLVACSLHKKRKPWNFGETPNFGQIVKEMATSEDVSFLWATTTAQKSHSPDHGWPALTWTHSSKSAVKTSSEADQLRWVSSLCICLSIAVCTACLGLYCLCWLYSIVFLRRIQLLALTTVTMLGLSGVTGCTGVSWNLIDLDLTDVT